MLGGWQKEKFVLFCPIKKRSFNLLCVLDLFSERCQSSLFQIFFSFSQWKELVTVWHSQACPIRLIVTFSAVLAVEGFIRFSSQTVAGYDAGQLMLGTGS